MTSFTKALYRRDPAAAQAFYKNQTFEHRLIYGRHVTLAQFTPPKPFGKRVPLGRAACDQPCGHPACSHGCTLPSR